MHWAWATQVQTKREVQRHTYSYARDQAGIWGGRQAVLSQVCLPREASCSASAGCRLFDVHLLLIRCTRYSLGSCSAFPVARFRSSSSLEHLS